MLKRLQPPPGKGWGSSGVSPQRKRNRFLPTLGGRLQRIVGRLVMSGAKMAGLLEDAMFSPACGLAGLTEGQAEIVARTVVQLAEELPAHG